jgi:hypothetical protein
MGKVTDKIKAFFGRRAVTREEAEELSDWVNEGGAYDPEGPPRVIDKDDTTK